MVLRRRNAGGGVCCIQS